MPDPLESLLRAIAPPVRIKMNALLHSEDKGMALEHVLKLFALYRSPEVLEAVRQSKLNGTLTEGDAKDVEEMVAKYSLVSEELIYDLSERYGEAALYRLYFLVNSHSIHDLRYFLRPIAEESESMSVARIFSSSRESRDLVTDNHLLRQDAILERFNYSLVRPSLSKRLFNPGRHHGYFVHGIGGARILISHPFQGIKRDVYDLYLNSLDVTVCLRLRGFFGTMLFLDYLGGLNREWSGVPGWALWFSIIAGHSDLVIFVQLEGEELGPAQRLEAMLTPDRVQKKIVTIPQSEIKQPEPPAGEMTFYFTGDGGGQEAFEELERKHATPYIEEYCDLCTVPDSLHVLDEEGKYARYRLDSQFYVDPDKMPAPIRIQTEGVDSVGRG